MTLAPSPIGAIGSSLLEAYMQPGWHPTMPANTYHAMEAASSHRLVKIRKGPDYCWESIQNPMEQTDSTLTGSAMHCMTIRPADFDHEFILSGSCERTLASGANKGKRCRNAGKYLINGEWICGTHVKSDRFEAVYFSIRQQLELAGYSFHHESSHGSLYFFHNDGRCARVSDHAPGHACSRRMIQQGMEDFRVDLPPYGQDDPRQILTEEQFERVVGMRDAIMANDDARPFIDRAKHVERSGVFIHTPTGQLCKMRPDIQSPDGREPFQADLKQCRDVSERFFDNQIAALGYDHQGSMYHNGARILGEHYEHFAFIAVEPKRPHGVRVYRLLDDVLEFVWDEVQQNIKTYRDCRINGKWPAIKKGIRDIGLQSLRRARERADERMAEIGDEA